nr:hypothetical protein [Tanacetum cinerariifolium]
MAVFNLNQAASSLSEEDYVATSNSHVVSVNSSINTGCDSFSSYADNASSSNSSKTPKALIHQEFINTLDGSVYWVPRVSASVLPVLGTVYDSLDECIEIYWKYASEAGFSIRLSCQKRLKCGYVKHKTQLFKKVSDQKDNTQDTSKNTKFAKQPIVENLSKIGKTNALSKQVTFNSVSTPQVSKGVNNDKVIAPGMFRISLDKISREVKKMPNTVSASSRTKPITVSQPSVINKKNVNSDLNSLSSIRLDNTKTRRPQPRSNTKNDRVPSASKSSRSKNKEVKVEEHHRNLLLSKKNKHISSACNNSKIDSTILYLKIIFVIADRLCIDLVSA